MIITDSPSQYGFHEHNSIVRVSAFIYTDHQSVETKGDGHTTKSEKYHDLDLFRRWHLQFPSESHREDEYRNICHKTDHRICNYHTWLAETMALRRALAPVGVDWVAHEDLNECDDDVVEYHHRNKAVDSDHCLGKWLEDTNHDVKETSLHKQSRWRVQYSRNIR